MRSIFLMVGIRDGLRADRLNALSCFRFRYECEGRNTGGAIQGRTSTTYSKTHPTIKVDIIYSWLTHLEREGSYSVSAWESS